MTDKKPSRKGILRNRWRAMLEDGSLVALGSEGRLVAHYVVHYADWTTCEVRSSMRHIARKLGAHVTTVRRGVAQMLEAGLIEVVHKPEGGGRTKFRIPERARSVCAPDTGRARERTQGVCAPDTLRVRPEHATCAPRTQGVRAAHTLCARNSVLSSGIPVNTTGTTSAAEPGAGLQPAPASRPSGDEDSAGVAGEVA